MKKYHYATGVQSYSASTVIHPVVALVLCRLSLYGSCSTMMSMLASCIVCRKSNCTIRDLFIFCCMIVNRVPVGFVSRSIIEMMVERGLFWTALGFSPFVLSCLFSSHSLSPPPVLPVEYLFVREGVFPY